MKKIRLSHRQKYGKDQAGMSNIGFNVDTYVSVPKGEISRLKTVLERNDPLIAPINEGHRWVY